MREKSKYIWLTDTHLNKVNPITKTSFIYRLRQEKPKGIFLTGDISNGLLTGFDLKIMAKFLGCPIYFVLGNHDYHFSSSFEDTHVKIRELCKENPNLIWMTESDPIPLTEEIAVIGTEGWYDAGAGNAKYLKVTPDWLMIKELRDLSTMEDRVLAFQKLADESCIKITKKLEQALSQGYKTIYLLTHIPPWREATRNVGTIFENFWLPYNANLRLGDTIEKIMKNHPDRHVICLAGHTHDPKTVRICSNIECHVGYPYDKKYWGHPIFI
jgi:predicted MPP superfamily phosphohydrolase